MNQTISNILRLSVPGHHTIIFRVVLNRSPIPPTVEIHAVSPNPIPDCQTRLFRIDPAEVSDVATKLREHGYAVESDQVRRS